MVSSASRARFARQNFDSPFLGHIEINAAAGLKAEVITDVFGDGDLAFACDGGAHGGPRGITDSPIVILMWFDALRPLP